MLIYATTSVRPLYTSQHAITCCISGCCGGNPCSRIMQSSISMFGCHGQQLTSAPRTNCLATAACVRHRSIRADSVNARVAVRSTQNARNGHHTVELDRVTAPMPLFIQNDTAGEVQQLRDSVQELVSTVKAQQLALAQQQATIQQLQSTVEQLQSSSASLSTLPAAEPQQQRQQTSSSGKFVWDSSIRPYEAQKAALWDRRARGLFDARYHSTSV